MDIRVKISVIFFIVIFLSGCAKKVEVKPTADTGAKLQKEIMRLNTPQEQGSLWVEGRAVGYYADIKARRVGDIITVKIVESSRAKKDASTRLDRDSEISGSLAGQDMISVLKEAKAGVKFKKDFNGRGSTSRSDSLTATVTAFVTEVFPNGNMKIEGTREIKLNNETQYIHLSGIIRPDDILTDNTVLSSNIADTMIEYSGKGLLSEKQHNGWMARMLDYIWPF